MICASYDHNMLTFKVFLSLSFLFHFSYACFQKLYIHRYLWEKLFSLYTYIPIHEKNFFFSIYTCIWKTLSLYINMVYIKPLFLFKNFFFHFQYTLVVYTKNFFIYTHCSHTRISFHTLFIYKNFFSFLFFIYKYDILFTTSLSFSILGVIATFVCFIFRMTLLNENSTWFQNFNKYYRQ